MNPSTRSRKRIAYIDVFQRKGKCVLAIANNERHYELWRSTDPQIKKSVDRYKGAGVEVFIHLV